MRNLIVTARTRGVPIIMLMGVGLLSVAGCGPTTRDMPVLIVHHESTVEFSFPQCEGQGVTHVQIDGQNGLTTWSTYQEFGEQAAESRIVTLTFTDHELGAWAQDLGVPVDSQTGDGGLGDGFFDLKYVEALTTHGKALLPVARLNSEESVQLVLSRLPVRNDSVTASVVSIEEGHQELLDWCDG